MIDNVIFSIIYDFILLIYNEFLNGTFCMKWQETPCWTFLKDHRIPLDNNTAERAIRPYVIWRKLSFASQSYQGDQFRPVILSIVGTAQRLGISSYQFIRSACTESMAQGRVDTRFVFNPPPKLTHD